MNVRDCEFLQSAVKPDQFPKHSIPEIALVGRSNVGKSSLINALLGRTNLARTSSRPGRTQTINFYRVDKLGLVDLPGYGYAAVPQRIKSRWGPMIEQFFAVRQNVVGVLQLVDLRHPPTRDDQDVASWLRQLGMPFTVIATKADKLGRGRQSANMRTVKQQMDCDVIAFSAQTKQGKDRVWAAVNAYRSIGTDKQRLSP